MQSKLPSTATWEVLQANTVGHFSIKTGCSGPIFFRSDLIKKKKKRKTSQNSHQQHDVSFFVFTQRWMGLFFCPSPSSTDDSVAPRTPLHVGCYPPPLPSCEVSTLCRVNVAVRSASQFSIRPKIKEDISVSMCAIVHIIWFLDVTLHRSEEHQKMPCAAT